MMKKKYCSFDFEIMVHTKWLISVKHIARQIFNRRTTFSVRHQPLFETAYFAISYLGIEIISH